MNRRDFTPQIPYGTRDILPGEAKQKRIIEDGLVRLFAAWGYDEVVTPTFEYLETVAVGAGNNMTAQVFKFFDRNNRVLALRPDMTTPIARVAATRLKDVMRPLRLFYLTNVFRLEQEAQAGRRCEFYQAGVELMGIPGPAADAEVIALAAAAMLEAGLDKFQIGLGQVQFINGVMEESGLEEHLRQQVKQCLVSRDLVGLGEILDASELKQENKNLIKQIPLLHGGEKVLDQARRMVNNETSQAALDNLGDIYRLLKSYGLEQYVNFDLGIIRDFDYYTGMVFEGYTSGLGFPLCGGGRYDSMVGSFGSGCPATGFALGIERILLALERQGISISCDNDGIYIGWAEGLLAEAIGEASKLRKRGSKVELGLVAQSREAASDYGRDKGYKRLVYME